jgi:hypothetical protein
VATNLGPGKEDLCGCDLGALLLGETLRNGLDLGVGEEERGVDHVVSKGRVGGNVNVLLLAVSDELRLDEERVTLDLVGSGSDTGTLDEGLEVLLGVVGNTDGASLGLGQFGHGLPCVNDGDAVINLNVAIRLVSSGQREEVLADVLLAALERDGEVDEVELCVLICAVVNR